MFATLIVQVNDGLLLLLKQVRLARLGLAV